MAIRFEPDKAAASTENRRPARFCFASQAGRITVVPMKSGFLSFALAVFSAWFMATPQGARGNTDEGFIPLMDGRTFKNWKPAEEHKDTWTIENGAFVAHGDRCHLFYTGDLAPFTNFVLRVDVMTEPGSNGGIYFHTKYQPEGWPREGFECQVNNTHSDWIKTGSLYGLVNVAESAATDKKWWTQEVMVKGQQVTVRIDGKKIFEYNEPPGVQPGKDFARKINEGTFALQGHDPNSTIRYRNIRVKRLD